MKKHTSYEWFDFWYIDIKRGIGWEKYGKTFDDEITFFQFRKMLLQSEFEFTNSKWKKRFEYIA